MSIENAGPFVATIGGGFFGGILIGYALKKVVKLVAIVVGLFAGLAYLQYQQIVNIDWNKLQPLSQNAAITVLNASKYIPRLANVSGHTTNLTISDFGIPLTGSMAIGFTLGFVRG
ncbi:MAG: FUN14 domain-containing protein [Thermoproteota archaeon]|nr:FUN14 domain-containing protein [Thermoproteota archaeon]